MKSRKQRWKNLRRLLNIGSAEGNGVDSSAEPSPRPPRTSATYPFLKGEADSLLDDSEFTPTNDATSNQSSSSSLDEDEPLSIVFNKCDSPFHNEGRVLIDTTIACPLNELYDLIFTPTKFFVDTLKSEKITDIRVGTWTPPDEHGERRRTTKFVVPVAGPGFAKIAAVQHLRLLSCSRQGQFYGVDARMVQHGIPYADSFYTQVHYCVEKISPEATRVVVTAQLVYVKSVWRFVKLVIEDISWKTLERFYGALGGRVAQVNKITPERRREMMAIAECQLPFMEADGQVDLCRGPRSSTEKGETGSKLAASGNGTNAIEHSEENSSTGFWGDEPCEASSAESAWLFSNNKAWVPAATLISSLAFGVLLALRRTMKASAPMWALLAVLLLVVFGLGAINSQLYSRLWAAEERLNVVMVSNRMLMENATGGISGTLLPDHTSGLGPVIKLGSFMDDVRKHLNAAEAAMRALKNELGLTELTLLDASEVIIPRQNAPALFSALPREGST